jgi:membrane-bound lytic murein transglycosylase A
MTFLRILCLILCVPVFCGGCARKPLLTAEPRLVELAGPTIVHDDPGMQDFSAALEEHIAFLQSMTTLEGMLAFGDRQIPWPDYLRALEAIQQAMDGGIDPDDFSGWLKMNFSFYGMRTDHEEGAVFITSYYDPVVKGSTQRTERFNQPLYRPPDDLVSIRLDAFAETFPKLSELKKEAFEQKSRGAVLRGRLDLPREPYGTGQVVPYYNRKEIDTDHMIDGRGYELAWVDPLDAFFLQIQGSGIIELEEGGRLRLGYAAQNGHSYVAIGKHLLHVIPRDEMSMQAIRDYLQTLDPEEQQRIFNLNPSYVFFRPLKGRSVTFLGSEAFPGRTIATDRKFFPKGALAYIEFPGPVFADSTSNTPYEWRTTSKFVLDQDTGGAIRGPQRLDIYWGEGEEAARSAGLMRHWGKLYYLVPKPGFLAELVGD